MKTMITLAAALLCAGILCAAPAPETAPAGKNPPREQRQDRRKPPRPGKKPHREKNPMALLNQHLPGIQELFPEEYAKVQELLKKDPQSAKQEMQKLRKKLMEQRKKDFAAIRAAFKAYQETGDEAKLAEGKKLLAEKVALAVENAKKQIEIGKQELESIRKLNLSGKNLREIEALYRMNINNLERFAKIDVQKFTERLAQHFTRKPGAPAGKQAPPPKKK
ncbi:MAG: hypothetical protein IJW05_06500 [Lentisphaeria bacterium]|nr:hypothetical protein [Lentisphaeria bacterium]